MSSARKRTLLYTLVIIAVLLLLWLWAPTHESSSGLSHYSAVYQCAEGKWFGIATTTRTQKEVVLEDKRILVLKIISPYTNTWGNEDFKAAFGGTGGQLIGPNPGVYTNCELVDPTPYAN